MSIKKVETHRDRGRTAAGEAVVTFMLLLVGVTIGRAISDRVGADNGRGGVVASCPADYHGNIEIDLNSPLSFEYLQDAAASHNVIDNFAKKGVTTDRATLLGELVCLQTNENTGAYRSVLLPAGMQALGYIPSNTAASLPAGFSIAN